MNTLSHALIADVLASLENAGGTPLGTAAYLQVQELVNQLPDDTRPEDLKTLLAPLLCRSEDEQEQFYEIFKKSWARVQETGELAQEEIEVVEEAMQGEKQRRNWLYIILALALIGCGLFCWYWMSWSNDPLSNDESIMLSIEVGDPERSHCFEGMRVGMSMEPNAIDQKSNWSTIKNFENICPENNKSHTALRIDTVNHCVYFQGISEGTDSTCLRLRSERGFFQKITLIINVLSKDTSTRVLFKELAETPDTVLYQVRDLPYPRTLSVLKPPEPTPWQQFLMDYEWLLKIAFILLSGLLLWWLARRFEQKRRRLIAEHQPNVKPPYTWNISLGAEPDVAFGEDFYALLLQLRRRESDELWRLDVPRTVRATVDKGGMPEFRYTQQTRPAEYLLLIDRQSGRDHQARLFDLLYRECRSQEVLVERYWYDEGDPRRCYNEAHPNGVSLRDLQYFYPQSRVLLLGNAYALLHPGTGNLSKWAVQVFSAWSDRAVLSTQPLSTFGRRERILQELFHVLPASLSGLRDAIELFDADEGKTPDLNPRRFPDAAQEPIQLIDNDLIKTIQSVAPSSLAGTDDEKFIVHHSSFIIWVSACAMYPELHWDLTLQLAHLIDGIAPSDGVTLSHPVTKTAHHSSLITHHSLQAITRLPWFTEGEMPLEVRQTLLAWLEREHPETHYRLREGLHGLLAQNPPPEGSAAYDDYAMNLALNEWLYTRDAERKKELQRDIAARLAAGQQADFMVLRMLDPGRSLTPEQFEVPADWKKHLREKGFAFLNPRRAWWWAVPVWLVLCGLALWWQPESAGCKGLSEIYKNKEYCIETFEEWAIFREMLVQDMLLSDDATTADSICRLMLAIGWSNDSLSGNNSVVSNPMIFFKEQEAIDSTTSSVIENTASDNYANAFNLMMSELHKNKVQYLESEKDKPYLDSVSFLQNAAVAYFNEGAKIHKSYSSMWETVERSAQKPVGANYRSRGEACAYFSRAQEINALLPDTAQLWYVRDAAKCNLPVVRQSSKPAPTALQDIRIYGQLNNAVKKRSLYMDEWMATKIEARGLPPATLSRGAFFNIRVPGDRRTPVELNITSPGFEPLRMTIRPADFGKYQTIELVPLQKCYELLRAQGIVLMNEKKYDTAGGMFTAAAQCADAPATNDLPGLLEQAGKLALTEQQRSEQEARDRSAQQLRLDTERQANADDDGDGVANKDDQCPNEKGTTLTKGCPDQDGDGIPDKEDKCPTEKGSADNGGCPPPGKDLAAVLAEIDANMVTVAGGTFQMGCDEKIDGDCLNDEKPVHRVTLSSYAIAKFEVTQTQWQAVMGSNPSAFRNCDNCPVEQVSWDDVQAFLTKLNTLSDKKYRLPTEAEWEYAARGGPKPRNFKYAGGNKLEDVGWYGNNTQKKTYPVGSKKANELGVYDMSGNIWEWCSDWYGEYNLGKITMSNPQGPEKGDRRVLRGGSWLNDANSCRVANRNDNAPTSKGNNLGVRLARSF